jgi:hypothetical protein
MPFSQPGRPHSTLSIQKFSDENSRVMMLCLLSIPAKYCAPLLSEEMPPAWHLLSEN